ncbi:MAG: transposase family protein [Streptomycetaceae bacterium]|nr:transposase family protein [Streptomycetaceae bacterium]
MKINDTCTDTDATLLLGLEGLGVIKVEKSDGLLVVHVATTDAAARACPECGVFSRVRKGRRLTRPRQLPYGGQAVELVWHKSRWRCMEARCPRTSFTEHVRQVRPGRGLPGRCGARRGGRWQTAAVPSCRPGVTWASPGRPSSAPSKPTPNRSCPRLRLPPRRSASMRPGAARRCGGRIPRPASGS